MAGAVKGLGSVVSRLQAQVQPALKSAESQVVGQYNRLMDRNKQYVVKDADAADKLLKQYVFTKLSRIPSIITHSQQEWDVLKRKFAERSDLPLPEVATYALFAGELYAWFVVGEIVGRGGTLTGYEP